jgi:protein-tyrosine phosphatase
VALLQQALEQAAIPLGLLSGADVHIVPDLLSGLNDGRILTLAGSRYVLLEPPHHTMPPQFEDCIFRLQSSGYEAVLTHPERLSWIEPQYALIRRMVHKGLWIQLTAGSLTGRFGQAPRYWAERMLGEGLCHVMATDAHNTSTRPPHLARAQAMVEQRLGAAEAVNIFRIRPTGVIENVSPAKLPPLPGSAQTQQQSGWKGLAHRFRMRKSAN